jgi:hypothetical protein
MALPFGSQLEHSGEPDDDEKELSPHGVHTANGDKEVSPAGQGAHVDGLDAATAVEL